jgi:hypothetical protein
LGRGSAAHRHCLKGREILEFLKDGALQHMSIGFDFPKDKERNSSPARLKTNGITYQKEIKLWEIRLVTFPANTGARVTRVKSDCDKSFDVDTPGISISNLPEVGRLQGCVRLICLRTCIGKCFICDGGLSADFAAKCKARNTPAGRMFANSSHNIPRNPHGRSTAGPASGPRECWVAFCRSNQSTMRHA